MNFLVTGGAGFIGSHVCERLLRSGEAVWAFDDLNAFYDPQLKRRNLPDPQALARPFENRWLWAAIALAQWLGYGAVALYQVLPRPPQLPKLLALGVFFLTLNWAFAVGFWRYVTGRYSGSWRTARA